MPPDRRYELSQLISQLSRLAPDQSLSLPDGLRPVGSAFRIGITGPVGAGKSSLISQLARNYRHREQTVGVIAVDPTSPFTGGALLGDRIRMTELALDPGVFVRSLATRGATGGLASVAIEAADLLDAFHFDRIILETVGVGQSEIDVAGACDVTCVIFDPGAGDSIQAMKAGLMEIADLFVVNKKDVKGADRFILDLATVLEMKPNDTRPDIIATSANSGEGVPELTDWLENYYQQVFDSGKLIERRAGQRVERIRRLANEAAIKRLWETLPDPSLLRAVNSHLPAREAARLLVEEAFGESSHPTQ